MHLRTKLTMKRGFNMKQQEIRAPQVGEPRNEKPAQKKRLLIVKLEERLAPNKHTGLGPGYYGCTGIGGGGTQSYR